jgi:type II secretory pathway component HofQ
LNEEKERYENLKNLYTDIVNSIEQRRAEQGKLQVELKSIKKEISALEISVNKKERVNKEEADLLKSFYFKASQDLECFNTKLSKLRDQIFHDQTTVDSATADIITKSNSENVTAGKIKSIY